MTDITVRHAYSPRMRVAIDCSAGGRTKQAFKDECNINRIMDKYLRTGLITHLNTSEPNYGVAQSVTYHDAMNVVAAARQQFESLPAAIRAQFGNRPETYLEFVENPENRPALVEMGLLPESELPTEDPVATPESPLTAPDEPTEEPPAV